MLIRAYTMGFFPMAESRESPDIHWYSPEKRGIINLSDVHVPKSLAKTIRKDDFIVKIDTKFYDVISACGSREETWLNQTIFDLYLALHDAGFAHSVEVWVQNTLVGGLYGVAIGCAFFGESMFSIQRDTSKIALIYLAARLIYGKFTLLDTQFTTSHLAQFGGQEIDCSAYLKMLYFSVKTKGDFFALNQNERATSILQIIESAKNRKT